MLLIHWSKHNNTGDILKNGIRPHKRKSQSEDVGDISGVWCFPFTRNKTLNNNWKSNLKVWRQDVTNFNGFVFKLTEEDFPIYAGDFSFIACFPEESIFDSMDAFLDTYGKYFSPQQMSYELTKENLEKYWLDYQDFEIILPGKVEPKRIVKVIKDRKTLKKYSS